MSGAASVLMGGLQGLFPLFVVPEVFAGHVTELAFGVAHHDPGMNLEDQAACGRGGRDTLGIDRAPFRHLDGAGGALGFGQCFELFQRLREVKSQMTPLQELASGSYTHQRAFELVQHKPRIATELADRIVAALVGTVDGDGDEIFFDQLDVCFGPKSGRTAHVAAAASAHPNTDGLT